MLHVPHIFGWAVPAWLGALQVRVAERAYAGGGAPQLRYNPSSNLLAPAQYLLLGAGVTATLKKSASLQKSASSKGAAAPGTVW